MKKNAYLLSKLSRGLTEKKQLIIALLVCGFTFLSMMRVGEIGEKTGIVMSVGDVYFYELGLYNNFLLFIFPMYLFYIMTSLKKEDNFSYVLFKFSNRTRLWLEEIKAIVIHTFLFLFIVTSFSLLISAFSFSLVSHWNIGIEKFLVYLSESIVSLGEIQGILVNFLLELFFLIASSIFLYIVSLIVEKTAAIFLVGILGDFLLLVLVKYTINIPFLKKFSPHNYLFLSQLKKNEGIAFLYWMIVIGIFLGISYLLFKKKDFLIGGKDEK